MLSTLTTIMEAPVSTNLLSSTFAHERLIQRWLSTADPALVAPGVRWLVMEGHPACGIYTKQGYYRRYLPGISQRYVDWAEEINEFIGTGIGAIVAGQYTYRLANDPQAYTLPFVHFYRIVAGRVVQVRYCAATVRVRKLISREQLIN